MVRTRQPIRAALVAALLAAALAPSAPGATLPAGAQVRNIGGVTYFVANGVYYKPAYSGGGAVYQVVPSP